METDKARSGIDPDLLGASAEEALSALARAGSRAAELVDAWVKQGNAPAVAVAAERAGGQARKAARRGLNVLRSRRIAIPEQAHVAMLAAREEPAQTEAFMLPPDGSGSLLFVISQRAGAGRTSAAFVFLNDTYGVLRVENGSFSQSQLKESMARVTQGTQKPVSVPVEWARARVAAARKRQTSRGLPEPLGLTTAAPLLEPVPDQAPAHPFDEEGLVLADEDARELARGSARLHQLPEFRGWLPPRQAVEQMLVEVGRQFTPGVEPEQAEVQKQLEAQVVAATDRYFSPQVRERLVTLMKDSVLGVLARAGEQTALEVVAAMKAIEQAGLITDPPHEVPFLRAFFDKAVAWMIAQNKGSLRIPVPNRLPSEALSEYPNQDPGAALEPSATSAPAGTATPEAEPRQQEPAAGEAPVEARVADAAKPPAPEG